MKDFKRKKNHLVFHLREFKRKFIHVYQWNRKDNKYTYFCSCSNVWFRSGQRYASECLFCKKPVESRNIKKCSMLTSLIRAWKTALSELKQAYGK